MGVAGYPLGQNQVRVPVSVDVAEVGAGSELAVRGRAGPGENLPEPLIRKKTVRLQARRILAGEEQVQVPVPVHVFYRRRAQGVGRGQDAELGFVAQVLLGASNPNFQATPG